MAVVEAQQERAYAGARAPGKPWDLLPRRAYLALVALAVAAFYVAVVGATAGRYGGNLSSLVVVGQKFVGQDTAALGHHVVVMRHSEGYDGQYYYLIAEDPFLRHPTLHDAFRYQRIGYPLLIWAVSLGRRDLEPFAMVAINLAAVAIATYLAGLILLAQNRRANPLLAAACLINPSIIIAVQRDLIEPLALALCLGGLALYLRGRVGLAAPVMAAALLTRETSALFLVPLIMAQLYHRRVQGALLLSLAILPYVAWELVLKAVWGHSGTELASGNFSMPFAGIAPVLYSVLHATHGDFTTTMSRYIMLIVAGIGVAGVLAAVSMWKRPHVITAILLLHTLAALCGSPAIWMGYEGAARVFGGVFPLTVCVYAREKGKPWLALVLFFVALAAVTAEMLVVLWGTAPYYLTP